MGYDPSKDTPYTKEQALQRLDFIGKSSTRSMPEYEELTRIHGLLSGTLPEVHREVRYCVIKLSDLSVEQKAALQDWMNGKGIKGRKSLVIEADWPEYEPAWAMVSERIQREKADEALCKDEGCPHAGTPHVCIEAPAKPTAYCPTCKLRRSHHGDPNSIHLHLCDFCGTPVEY